MSNPNHTIWWGTGFNGAAKDLGSAEPRLSYGHPSHHRAILSLKGDRDVLFHMAIPSRPLALWLGYSPSPRRPSAAVWALPTMTG